MADLQLAVKKEYFEQIRDGVKPFEYRARTDYWKKRLLGRAYDKLIITCGYPSKDDADRRIEMPYKGCREMTITHPFFGDEPVEVFAITLTVN